MRNLFLALLGLSLAACHPDVIDSGDDTTEYTDMDGDGFDTDSDCDDWDGSVYPGADEICDDGIDNDCDGQIDEDCEATDTDAPDTEIIDEDGDGWAAEDDCDDNDGSINPGRDEVCDGVDNDCDGLVDELDECADDPDDTAAEDCNNGLDDDNDGLIDEADGDCDAHYDGDNDGYCEAESSLDCYDGSQGGDCDDTDANINPDAEETAGDSIDNNCDDLIDVDLDADGELSVNDGGEDCNDNDATVNTYATELINGVDDNCDGLVDPVNVTFTASELQVVTWYQGGVGYGWEQLVLEDVEYTSSWEWIDVNATHDTGSDWVGMVAGDNLLDYGFELIELEAVGTGTNILLNPAFVPVIEDSEGTNGHLYAHAFLQQAEADAGW